MSDWESVRSEYLKKGDGYQWFQSKGNDSMSLACKEILSLRQEVSLLREEIGTLESEVDSYIHGSL